MIASFRALFGIPVIVQRLHRQVGYDSSHIPAKTMQNCILKQLRISFPPTPLILSPYESFLKKYAPLSYPVCIFPATDPILCTKISTTDY